MVSLKGYEGKRVVLLINAHAYDSINSINDSAQSSLSLVLVCVVISEDEINENVRVKDIEVKSRGLFYNKDKDGDLPDEDQETLIKIKTGQFDKRFIISFFDEFEELDENSEQ